MSEQYGGGETSLGRKEKKRKVKEYKKEYLIIKILAQNLTISERCPKITENRKYYPET